MFAPNCFGNNRMGRLGQLRFEEITIQDIGNEESDNPMSMYDDDCSIALEEIMNTGRVFESFNNAKPTIRSDLVSFDLDNSDERWDKLLLSEAYHYETKHKGDHDSNVSANELSQGSTYLEAKPSKQELIKQSSSRILSHRALFPSTRQTSSGRLLQPVDRSSSQSLLGSFSRTDSSQSLLSFSGTTEETKETREDPPNCSPCRRSQMTTMRQSSSRRVLLTRQSSSKRLLFASVKKPSSRRLLARRQISSPSA